MEEENLLKKKNTAYYPNFRKIQKTIINNMMTDTSKYRRGPHPPHLIAFQISILL
jgi:hypothetical protein